MGPVDTAGCQAFTPELRSFIRARKPKPDLPPRHMMSPPPCWSSRQLKSYIKAANGDEQLPGDWFLMASGKTVRQFMAPEPARGRPPPAMRIFAHKSPAVLATAHHLRGKTCGALGSKELRKSYTSTFFNTRSLTSEDSQGEPEEARPSISAFRWRSMVSR